MRLSGMGSERLHCVVLTPLVEVMRLICLNSIRLFLKISELDTYASLVDIYIYIYIRVTGNMII